jgi:pantoate--beta-alanine ligase
MAFAPVIFKDLAAWNDKRRMLRKQGRPIGFVPTMGALHAGHGSLLERCRRENEVTVLSIYVNPTQFDNKDDLLKYPATLDRDRELAHKAGVDFIIAPNYEQMYPDQFSYRLTETGLSEQLEGAHRPGHFTGMLTVVLKLLNLVQADRAYFGEKDYQQLQLVKAMAAAFFLDTEIVACPTVREADGLAMSSRNVNLSHEARAIAPLFHRALVDSSTSSEARAYLKLQGFEIDYVEDVGTRRFGAVKLGGVRLIDNVKR